MYVRPISTRFSRGTLTPAIRATLRTPLSLPLLVPRVLTDHQHSAAAPDDPALVAHDLDAGTDFHAVPPGRRTATAVRCGWRTRGLTAREGARRRRPRRRTVPNT